MDAQSQFSTGRSPFYNLRWIVKPFRWVVSWYRRFWQPSHSWRIGKGPIVLGVALATVSCSLPQVNAEDRLFLDLSVDFLGDYNLPRQSIDGVRVGGLSALAYDRPSDRFYAVSDDRSKLGPARFYRLKLDFADRQAPLVQSGQSTESTIPAIASATIEKAIVLRDEAGATFPPQSVDPEGLALTPRQSVLISGEADAREQIEPLLAEFDLETGQFLRSLPIPAPYRPSQGEDTSDPPSPQGLRDNLGFEGLTIPPFGSIASSVEPFRAFVAIEAALHQDINTKNPEKETRTRILHYALGDGPPRIVSQHLYLLDPPPEVAPYHGLTDLLAIDNGGHFLSLERTFSPLSGMTVKLFQVALGAATDLGNVSSLRGDLTGINPARKRLLLNFADTPLVPDNLEGLALGPRLSDGTQSLILVSDDNFRDEQVTQFVLLRLNGYRPQ